MKVRFVALVTLLVLGLAGCGGVPGISQAQPSPTTAPTSTPRPSPTTAAKSRPTATARPQPTATTEAEEPTSGDMVDYEDPEGRFSLSHPSGWDVIETGAGVIIEEPNQEVLVRVLFYPLSGELDTEALADIANEQLAEEHADAYIEEGMVPQADGSIRVDYSIQASGGDPARTGQVFVEQKNQVAYELQIEVNADVAPDHADTVNEIIASYFVSDDAPPAEDNTSEGPGDAPAGVDFETYQATEGDYSIEYPADWTVTETSPNVQFLQPSGEALIQVTYADLGAELPHDQLVEIAAESLGSGFGEDYEEIDRVEQKDGSTRIDFRITQDPRLIGSAFIAQRGTGLYMLMVMVQEDQAETYGEILEYVVDTYETP